MMRKILTVLSIGLLAGYLAFGGVAAATQPMSEQTDAQAHNQSNNSTVENTPFGLQISVMMGKNAVGVDSAIEEHTFKYKMKNAESDTERKQIVNNFLNNEVSEVEQLNNTSSNSTYGQSMKIVKSQKAAKNAKIAQEVANDYNVGVNKSKVDYLSNNARNMSGQEVSEIARSLAGVDKPTKQGPPDGVPGHAPKNTTDEAVNETKENTSSENAERGTPEEPTSTPDSSSGDTTEKDTNTQRKNSSDKPRGPPENRR